MTVFGFRSNLVSESRRLGRVDIITIMPGYCQPNANPRKLSTNPNVELLGNEMARFVMSNLRAGRFTKDAKLKSRAALHDALSSNFMSGATIIRDSQAKRETARQMVIFEAEEAEVEEKRKNLDTNVVVEREVQHYFDSNRPMELLDRPRDSFHREVNFGNTATFKLTIQGNKSPLHRAKVILYLKLGDRVYSTSETTTRKGRISFKFSDRFSPLAIEVVPIAEFWPMIIRGARNGDAVDCLPLPGATNYLGWWHKFLGIQRFAKARGRGIKVGVVDTGAGPHRGLAHITDIGAFINNESSPPPSGMDIDSHGTHVCGIIGARPESKDCFAGIAPGVDLYSARVFQPSKGATQEDITNAIDALSHDHEVDLINLSLGATAPSEIERDAIIDAVERGTLCVCAAANSNGPVEYPAAFEETLGISAVGLLGWGPNGETQRLPSEYSRFGQDNLYHANFSCFGPQINGTAPGVGVISTVPEVSMSGISYAAMNGTSMASPAACAVLADVLSTDRDYKAMPRDQTRTEHAKMLFRRVCRDLGLDQQYQGWGMPQVG